MLKELRLSNFRLFDEEITVHFRPITVLIGRNNYGKSSIIKFLLMLKQSLNKDSTQFLNLEGNEVQFGDFKELANRLTKKENLTFTLTVSENKSSGDPLVSYIRDRYKTIDISSSNAELFFAICAEISYQEKNVKKHEATLFYKGKNILTQKKYIFDNFNLLDFSREWKDKEENNKQNDIKKRNVEKSIINDLRKNINNFYHLPPVRGIFEEGFIKFKEPPFLHVGKRGQYTLLHLKKMQDGDLSQYKFILPHIRDVAGIDEIHFNKLVEHISECLAKNKVTSAEVLIGHFGFGVSQCLPVFVQGAMMSPYSSLIVEQPEAQLHPTAQLGLGNFFADLWNKRNVGSIIETHSENIILRLRRLIAKGELQPEDVSIAFFDFDNTSKQPIIKELNINKDGSMEKGLPMEFFGKNLEEFLEMGIT